jgi:hypothetical protein
LRSFVSVHLSIGINHLRYSANIKLADTDSHEDR